jgi:TP901 family phage tail tape measure protein
VSVRLQADVSNYVSGMARASGATGLLEGSTRSLLSGQGALAVLAGGAVVAGFAAAISAAADFDKSMSGVQAATMASSSTMAELRATAIKAGADTAYSAVEAADGITELAKAGVSAKDIMGGGLKGALSLAAAGQIGVADAAQIGATALTVFGLAGSQMTHVADLLAAGAGKAQGSVADMSQALNQSALVAHNTGLSIDDTTGALALFASNGLIGSDAGTSFKTMLMSLNPNSDAAAKLMDQLNLSAYDAGGKFVGLSAYAGRLQTALSGMSEEQRNATLKTIFGNDAIRAASILYQAGSSGVDQWTGKVNDAGYASRQAAINQDNLRGDLEKLGGSWNSLMISLGSGAQGPLRDIVQAFTGVLNVGVTLIGMLSGIPTPVLVGVGALAAMALITGPLAGLFTTLAAQVGFATGVMAASGGVMAGLRVAAGGLLSALGGPMALAVAGVAAGLSFLIPKLTDTGHAAGNAADETNDFTTALKASKGAIDDNVKSAAAKTLQDKGLLGLAERSKASTADMTNGLLGQTDAYDRVVATMEDYHGALLIQAAFTRGEAGQALEDQAAGVQKQIDAYKQLGGAVPKAVRDAQQLAAATGQTGGALSGSAAAGAALTTQLQGVSDAASASKKQIDQLKTSLDVLTGAHITMAEADAAFYEALDKAKGAVDGLSGSVMDASGALNVQSEAGRGAQDALIKLHDEADTTIATMIQQGGTAAQVTERDAKMRESFYQTALSLTGSAAAAGYLTDQIYGIPAERTAKITAETAQADAAVAATQAQIDAMRGRTRRVIGDNVTSDEAYIPLDGSARSMQILAYANQRMARTGATREFTANSSGGGGVGIDWDRLARLLDRPTISIDRYDATADQSPVETAEKLARLARTRG